MKGLLDDTTVAVVPKRTRVRGQPHHLAYINDDERRVLRARGGGVTPDGGQMTHLGVATYFGDSDSDGGEAGGGMGDAQSEASPGSQEGDGKGDGVGGSVSDAVGGVADAVGFGGSFGAVSDPMGGLDTSDANGGDTWQQAYPGAPAPYQPPPLPGTAPRMTLQAATPVYTPMPEMQAPVQGIAPAGFAPGLEAMRAMFGPRPLPGSPPPSGGLQAPGSNVPMGAWQPPPVAPVQYPQETILNGQGGNGAYYEAMQRLAPGQMPMGYFDALRQYRRW
jgi:hypothetical protein